MVMAGVRIRGEAVRGRLADPAALLLEVPVSGWEASAIVVVAGCWQAKAAEALMTHWARFDCEKEDLVVTERLVEFVDTATAASVSGLATTERVRRWVAATELETQNEISMVQVAEEVGPDPLMEAH